MLLGVAKIFLYCRCIITINVLWLLFMVPRVGLQYVSVVFPYHTHLLINVCLITKWGTSLSSVFVLIFKFS